MIYRSFIHDPGSNAVFAYIPKVACTNWKAVMRRMAGHQDWLQARLAHDPRASGLRLYPADDAVLDRLLSDERVQLLAMVRNPFTRVLSAYLDKIARRLDVGPTSPRRPDVVFDGMVDEIEAFRANTNWVARPDRITFEVFLRWIEADRTPNCRNEHWAPQTSIIGPRFRRFDRIGRFEAMERDAAAIMTSMGAQFDFPSQKDVRFPGTDAQSKIAAHYSDAAIALVRRIYATDFEVFGYSTDLGAATEVLPALRPFG